MGAIAHGGDTHTETVVDGASIDEQRFLGGGNDTSCARIICTAVIVEYMVVWQGWPFGLGVLRAIVRPRSLDMRGASVRVTRHTEVHTARAVEKSIIYSDDFLSIDNGVAVAYTQWQKRRTHSITF